MKATLMVAGIKNNKDVNRIKNGIADNEGVIACRINKEKSVVEIVYDGYFLKEDNIIECIENLGYTVF